MKNQSLLILTLLLVISCSKPDVKKDVKIIEKEVAPVVEEPKIVKQKSTNEISHNLKEKWGQRIKKQQIKDKLQQENKKQTKILEQKIVPVIEEETEIAQATEDGAYKDGKRDGIWTFTDEKGIKEKEVIYNEDGQELWIFFDDEGKKTREGQMVDGKEEGLWIFYDENEIKVRETEHKSGQEDGIYSLWYDNGQKKEEGPYKGKTRIGLWTWWDEKGNKWQEGSYVDGKRDGAWITWNPNGKRRNETVYKNGGFISKKVY